jgi:hypothetical protein
LKNEIKIKKTKKTRIVVIIHLGIITLDTQEILSYREESGRLDCSWQETAVIDKGYFQFVKCNHRTQVRGEMLKFLIVLSFLFGCQSQLVVQTQYGPILGAQRTSALNRQYFSFQKIPYMRPPVS